MGTVSTLLPQTKFLDRTLSTVTSIITGIILFCLIDVIGYLVDAPYKGQMVMAICNSESASIYSCISEDFFCLDLKHSAVLCNSTS